MESKRLGEVARTLPIYGYLGRSPARIGVDHNLGVAIARRLVQAWETHVVCAVAKLGSCRRHSGEVGLRALGRNLQPTILSRIELNYPT